MSPHFFNRPRSIEPHPLNLMPTNHNFEATSRQASSSIMPGGVQYLYSAGRCTAAHHRAETVVPAKWLYISIMNPICWAPGPRAGEGR